MGKVLDVTECLLPYLEARGDDIYVLGLFRGSDKNVNYRACGKPWWSSLRVISWLGFLHPHDTMPDQAVVLVLFSCRKWKCEV